MCVCVESRKRLINDTDNDDKSPSSREYRMKSVMLASGQTPS